MSTESTSEEHDEAGEDAYWCEAYIHRPYAQGASYDDFGPAFAYGVGSFKAHEGHGHSFDDVEDELANDWETAKGKSTLTWEHAKHAVRDAWERLAR